MEKISNIILVILIMLIVCILLTKYLAKIGFLKVKRDENDCKLLAFKYINDGTYNPDKYLMKSIELGKQHENHAGVALDYGILGNINLEQEKLIEAEDNLSKALNLNEQLDNHHGIAENCGQLGKVFLLQGRYAEAEKKFQRSLDVWEELGWPLEIAFQYENLGILYKMQKRYEEALTFFIKVMMIAESFPAPPMKVRIEKELAEIMEKVGEDQFSQWMKEYEEMKNEPKVLGGDDTE